MESLIRSLQQASGDVVVVATVPTFEPYGDIREYAVKMFENHGRGIGQKGKDNGLLILLAVKDRQVWVEVGYDLEQFVTDGFAGETSRQVHGAGIPPRRVRTRAARRRLAHRRPHRAGPQRHAARAFLPRLTARPVSVQAATSSSRSSFSSSCSTLIARTRGRGGLGGWGWGGWSGWSSGVGPFGWTAADSAAGAAAFGGGFGGFGGGRSGGGGGGAGW